MVERTTENVKDFASGVRRFFIFKGFLIEVLIVVLSFASIL